MADGMKLVRGDLAERLDALEGRLARRGPHGAAEAVAAIARIAGDHDLRPVQRLAEGLTVALGEGGRGAAIGPWLEQLREAIGCAATDEASGSARLAAILTRLAG
jgi:hypothetical protein